MPTISEALQLAVQHHQRGEIPQAAHIYRQILAAVPDNPDALHLLGLIQRQCGQIDEAARLIRLSLASRPFFPEGYYNLGNTLRELHGPGAAIAPYRRSVALRPDFIPAVYNLGLAIYADGGLRATPKASALLRQTLAAQPDYAEVNGDLGALLKQDNRNQEAYAPLVRALRLDPLRQSARVSLGNLLVEAHALDKACAHLKSAIAIAPNQGAAYFNLGNALCAAGRLEQALSPYRRSARLGQPIGHNRLAATLVDLGRHAEAEATLRAILPRPDIDTGDALEQFSALLFSQGRFDEARAFLSAYPGPDGAPPGSAYGECLIMVAESYLRQGRIAEACAAIEPVQGDRSRLFTVKSLALLRRELERMDAPPPTRRLPETGRDRMASSTLATHGRFAHNVFEYVMLRLYAEAEGLDLHTPEWVGHYIFDLDEPLYAGRLPPAFFARQILNDRIAGKPGPRLANRDVVSPMWLYEHRENIRDRVRSWLRVRPAWRPFLDPLTDRLRAMGRTVVALHLRRGDFVQANYPISETRWFVDWLRALWPTLDAPVLYIASDDLTAVKADFAEFSPVSLTDAAEPWRGMEFMQDFHALMTADVVGISAASGFSLLAAMLNERAGLFVEPDVTNGAVRPFSPWRPEPPPFSS